MTKDEALKLALKALEHEANMGNDDAYKLEREAIKEALAQPEQEPVAFVQGCNRGQWEIFPAKAYQIFENEQPLYTTPPQRTWVGLTDEDEIDWDGGDLKSLIKAIEAKLKEKNT
jgi:hypothetical protein